MPGSCLFNMPVVLCDCKGVFFHQNSGDYTDVRCVGSNSRGFTKCLSLQRWASSKDLLQKKVKFFLSSF